MSKQEFFEEGKYDNGGQFQDMEYGGNFRDYLLQLRLSMVSINYYGLI